MTLITGLNDLKSRAMPGGLQQARVLFRRFLSWWAGELAPLVPARLRWSLYTSGNALLLRLSGTALTVSRIGAADPVGSCVLDLGDRAAAAGMLAQWLRGIGIDSAAHCRGMRSVLRLRDVRSLRRKLVLPLAVEENLREAVSFEIERVTPFKAPDVMFGFRPLLRDAANRKLELELTVTPRRAIEDRIAFAAELGFVLSRIEIEGDTEGAPPSGNLLPEDSPLPLEKKASTRSRILLGIVVLLACAAIYLPIGLMEGRADLLEDRFGQRKQDAEEAARLKTEIAATEEAAHFLVDRKRQSPTVSQILAEVARVMPDDTWLVELQLNGGEIQLAGLSASASALVAALEQSGRFSGTEFRSPVTRDPKTAHETFQIAARIGRKDNP